MTLLSNNIVITPKYKPDLLLLSAFDLLLVVCIFDIGNAVTVPVIWVVVMFNSLIAPIATEKWENNKWGQNSLTAHHNITWRR